MKRTLRHPIIECVAEHDPAPFENIRLPVRGIIYLERQRVLSSVLHHAEQARVMKMDIRKVHVVTIPANDKRSHAGPMALA